MFKGFFDKTKDAIDKIDVKNTFDAAMAGTSEHLSSAKAKASELLDNTLPQIKELANKAKCAAGFHAGVLQKVEGKPECYKEKICPNCSELINESKHQYPDLKSLDYDEYGSCKKTLRCLHCQFEKYKIDHHGFSHVGFNGKCEEIEKCARCNEEKTSFLSVHEWVKVGINGHCEEIEKCARCKKERNAGKKVHYWVRVSSNGDGTVSYECHNCRAVEQRAY